jgi:CBS domain containing-hemolysin-like protein
MLVFTPVIWVLNGISSVIFRILRIDPNQNPNPMTESELRTIVDVSHEEGVIEQDEKKMITNVVDFGDALSKDIMVPRADMVCADAGASYDELIALLARENYSRIPIYQESKDHIIGILHVKDLFMYREHYDKESLDVTKIMRKPLFVYEYQKTARIFADMKTSSASVCIVLDEYGITAGLITMEDLIEEIVGDIRDEYDAEEANLIRKLEDNHYSIDASVKLDDLNDAINTELESEHYDSLGGYVIELMDRLPDEGDEVCDDTVRIKVLKMHKNRIERVELFLLQTQEQEEENQPEEEKNH